MRFETCLARRRDTPQSLRVEYFIQCLRNEIKALGADSAGRSGLSSAREKLT
jgi:hypothetical protein